MAYQCDPGRVRSPVGPKPTTETLNGARVNVFVQCIKRLGVTRISVFPLSGGNIIAYAEETSEEKARQKVGLAT